MGSELEAYATPIYGCAEVNPHPHPEEPTRRRSRDHAAAAESRPAVIDLFGGIGCVAQGLTGAGFEIVAHVDAVRASFFAAAE